MLTTTPRREFTAAGETLYVGLELSAHEWRLAYGVGLHGRVRQAVIRAGDREALRSTLLRARAQYGLPATAPVVSCYEAGRDGFWPHRLLDAAGVQNTVVDSSSIEVNRRARHMKTDRLDAGKLLRLLWRVASGETQVWHAVRVPTPAVEAERHASRAIGMLVGERTRWRNRIHGLLATVGVRLAITAEWPMRLAAVRLWDGTSLPEPLRDRLIVAWRQLQAVETELGRARAQQRAATRAGASAAAQDAQQLLTLRGIGERFAWVMATEICSRALRNRREVGALTGLTSVHYQSGTTAHDLGISRSGLAEVRGLAVEAAWVWVQWQPASALTQWFEARFAHHGAHMRRIGIVALARRLVIALWRYVREGVVPAGAVLKSRAA